MGGRVAIILGMGLGTYLLRALPLLVAHRVHLSPRMVRWFQCVSYSIIASFVWFGFTAGTGTVGILGLRVVGLGLTLLVAMWTRSALAGLVAGVVTVTILTRGAW